MALEFDKLIPQVEVMGRAIAHKTEDISNRGEQAILDFAEANDTDAILDKVELVIEKDAGYRGASPYVEAINVPYHLPAEPDHATLVAVDGSQIYPDIHKSVLYYLTNIGAFIYHHGSSHIPEQVTDPELSYADSDLRERNGHGTVIPNSTVNARRTVKEMTAVGRICYEMRDVQVPLLGIMDGPLLWMVQDSNKHLADLEKEYRRILVEFYEHIHLYMVENFGQPASLLGYTSRPDSRFVVRLLDLLRIPDDQISRQVIEEEGIYEGLTDRWLFGQILAPGERSAVMIQQSPRNKSYKQNTGDLFEVTFFYLNVGKPFEPEIARVEVPMWVARLPAALDYVHSLLYSQCKIANAYPYVLTRADELAVVRGQEKNHLEELIRIELLKNRQLLDVSAKQLGKNDTRANRRQFVQ